MMIAVASRNKTWAELYFFTKATNMQIEGSGVEAEGIAKKWCKDSYDTYMHGMDTPIKTDMVCFRKDTKQHKYLIETAKGSNKVWNIVMASKAWNTTHGLIDMPDKYEKYIRFVFDITGADFSRFYTYMKHKLALKDRMPTLDEGLAHYKDFELAMKFNEVK